MMGMHGSTGVAVATDEHLVQSIARILTTPLGTRVMRREFGSLLPALIDQPANAATRLLLYGATAMALMRWEPRVVISHIALAAGDAPGTFVLSLSVRRTSSHPASDLGRLIIPLNFR